MPLYDYRCPDGHEFEASRPLGERASAECKECGGTAKQVISHAPVLDPRMGVDKDFPTMAKKWDEKHRKLSTGRMKDSNNLRNGTNSDQDKEAYQRRKLYDR